MAELCRRYRPRFAVMGDPDSAARLETELDSPVQVMAGEEALQSIASTAEVDTVMAGIVGAAGLLPTMAAARAGKRILLANKESLVMAGELFMEAVRGEWRRAAADRQRAQRDLPVPAARLRRWQGRRCRAESNSPDRIRRAVSGSGSVARWKR